VPVTILAVAAIPEHNRPAVRQLRRMLGVAAACAVFAVLVTSNSAGYRYGVSDQAFYIPAVLDRLTPALFPHDSAMLEAQGHLSVFDDALAWVLRTTPLSMPALFLAGYVLTIIIFTIAVVRIGDVVFSSSWATAALLVALTLRHRVSGTGVNTFEGYFHPRVLAFSIGLLGIAALLRNERWLAAVSVLAAAIVHPTTGCWFVVWMSAGLAVVARRKTTFAVAGAAGAVLVSALAISGALPSAFTIMDADWLAVIAAKHYLFPTGWSPQTWGVNLLAPLVLLAIYRVRVRQSVTVPMERAVFWGCLALLAMFLVSLPFIAARVALAIQLQTSRVFWPLEVLATIYLVWLVVDHPSGRSSGAWRGPVLAASLALVSLARGIYILTVQFDRPLVQATLPDSDWRRTAEWAARHTPIDANFLVDPNHVGLYGMSFRVGASRDVFLEVVKDTAMATYSRAIALDIGRRQQAVPDFAHITLPEVELLARRYDLDYLVTEGQLPLPLVKCEGRFHVYALNPAAQPRGR
jgi:hypothetical protein